MALLGVDVGTTHCKAGLFTEEGTEIRIASRPMPVQRAAAGYAYYQPDEVWQTVIAVMGEAAGVAHSRFGGSVGRVRRQVEKEGLIALAPYAR